MTRGERVYNTESAREWECPNCGHTESRHHSAKKRPFCDPCDWQHAVLIEMKAIKNGEVVEV